MTKSFTNTPPKSNSKFQFSKSNAYFSIKGDEGKKKAFTSLLHYVDGSYASAQDFANLDIQMSKYESSRSATRVFYFAIPPSIFVDVAKAVKASAMSKTGETRLIIGKKYIEKKTYNFLEKPFGHDLESSNLLAQELSALFKEEQIYRIDHYLGNFILNLSKNISPLETFFSNRICQKSRKHFFFKVNLSQKKKI